MRKVSQKPNSNPPECFRKLFSNTAGRSFCSFNTQPSAGKFSWSKKTSCRHCGQGLFALPWWGKDCGVCCCRLPYPSRYRWGDVSWEVWARTKSGKWPKVHTSSGSSKGLTFQKQTVEYWRILIRISMLLLLGTLYSSGMSGTGYPRTMRTMYNLGCTLPVQ